MPYKEGPGEDNYKGRDYDNISEMVKDSCDIDDMSVSIKVTFMKEGCTDGSSLLSTYRFCPRHGIPVQYFVKGAKLSDFKKILRSIAKFLGHKSIKFLNLHDNEYVWQLGEHYIHFKPSETETMVI